MTLHDKDIGKPADDCIILNYGAPVGSAKVRPGTVVPLSAATRFSSGKSCLGLRLSRDGKKALKISGRSHELFDNVVPVFGVV